MSDNDRPKPTVEGCLIYFFERIYVFVLIFLAIAVFTCGYYYDGPYTGPDPMMP